MMARALVALSVALVAISLSGCGGIAQKEVRQAYDVVELAETDRDMAFEMLKPEERLTPWERQVILAFQVKRLGGAGWREAHQTLVAMGKDSIPILIQALDRKDPVHHELKPRYGAQSHQPKRVFTLGEMAYQVLVDIVGHYSNYKGPVPSHSRPQWERWWASNGSGLVVLGRGRALTTR